MTPVKFEGSNIELAKDQPQYQTLPAKYYKDSGEGKMLFCWKLTIKDRFKIFFGGRIWHSVYTFHSALQPTLLQLEEPEDLRLENKAENSQK
jgi:hypothetical protein